MEGQKKPKKVRCPRCGHVQPLSKACAKCKLDFVQYVKQIRLKKAAAAEAKEAEPPSAPPEPPLKPISEENAEKIKKLREISPVYEGRADLKSIEATFYSTWDIFKRRFLTLFLLHLLTIVFFTIGFGVFAGIGALLAFSMPEYWKEVLAIFGLIGAIAGIKGWVWAMAALSFAIVDETLGVGAALRKGMSRFMSFLWLYTLLTFIITGGFLLFVIPGIVFIVWFAPAQFVLAAEDERGMRALLKSKEYVKDRWFDVFLKLFLLWLISAAVGFASFILSLIPFFGLVFSMLNMLFSLFFVPFMMLFVFVIYDNLKEVKWVVSFPSSFGQKLKWVGAGALGYVLPPVLLVIFVGSVLNMAPTALMEKLMSQGLQMRTPPPATTVEPPPVLEPPPGPQEPEMPQALRGLQGVWQGVNVGDGSKWTITVSGSMLSAADATGMQVYAGTITLDDTKNPKRIDTRVDDSIERKSIGKTSLGIYMQEASLFILCSGPPGSPARPSEFKPAAEKSVCFELNRTAGAPAPATGVTAQAPAAAARGAIDDVMVYIYAINYKGSVKLNGKEIYAIKGERDMNYNSTAPANLKRGKNVFEVEYSALPDKPFMTEIRIKVFSYDIDTGKEETFAEWKVNDPKGAKKFELVM